MTRSTPWAPGRRASTSWGRPARYGVERDRLRSPPSPRPSGPLDRRARARCRTNPLPQHRRASRGGASSPATRRCDSSRATWLATTGRRPDRAPWPVSATAPARRPAGCSTTATRSTETARSWRGTIVPPTSQNQRAIEHDLAHVVEANLQLDDLALTARCEHTIRNYDPCISCATHFLDLRVDRVST